MRIIQLGCVYNRRLYKYTCDKKFKILLGRLSGIRFRESGITEITIAIIQLILRQIIAIIFVDPMNYVLAVTMSRFCVLNTI